MDQLIAFLEAVRAGGWAAGKFRGLLWVLVGMPVRLPDGEPISTGLSFRQLATLLRAARWDIEAVREFGLDPAALPPRDREKAWFAAITRAGLATDEAKAEGEQMAKVLRAQGYGVGAEEKG